MANQQKSSNQFFTENGATTITVATTGTTFTVAAIPAGLTTATVASYRIYVNGAASDVSYALTAVNVTAKTVTIATSLTVTANQPVWIGRPATVVSGMAQFYVRGAVIIPANSAVRFYKSSLANKPQAPESFTATNISTIASNLVKITPAIPTPAPSDLVGLAGVAVGGINVNLTDTITFVDRPSKSGVATQNTLTFTESLSAYRLIARSASEAFAIGQSVSARVVLPRSVNDTITLNNSAKGSAKKLNIAVTEAFTISDSVDLHRRVLVSVSETLTFKDTAILPMIGFTTPKTKVVPPILPDTRGPAYLLFRHYEIRERHVNVFKLKDGTFVQDYPTPENSNANVPYPYNPNDPTALYAYVHNWDGSIQEFHLPNPIVQVFLGGETTMVSQAIANELIHAGYGAYLEPMYA